MKYLWVIISNRISVGYSRRWCQSLQSPCFRFVGNVCVGAAECNTTSKTIRSQCPDRTGNPTHSWPCYTHPTLVSHCYSSATTDY